MAKKNESIELLKAMYLKQNIKDYPNLPDYARVTPKYTDAKTNGLTKCVYDFLSLSGFHVERTGNEGRIIDDRKKFVDTVGFQRQIGTIRRIKSSGTAGTSDLKAIINGHFVAIEIKCAATGDRQSLTQKDYEKKIITSGGTYVIVTTFEGFIKWFERYTNCKILTSE